MSDDPSHETEALVETVKALAVAEWKAVLAARIARAKASAVSRHVPRRIRQRSPGAARTFNDVIVRALMRAEPSTAVEAMSIRRRAYQKIQQEQENPK